MKMNKPNCVYIYAVYLIVVQQVRTAILHDFSLRSGAPDENTLGMKCPNAP